MNSIRNLIKVNGVDISYVELGRKGKGDDVIIMHGSFCNADIMLDYGKVFAKKNHVILIDLPGHYVSTTQRFMDFEALTKTIIETIKQFKELDVITKKPILHGWSLAGSITLNVAAMEPDLLKEGVILDGDSEWINRSIPLFENQEQFVNTFKGLISNPSSGVSKDVVSELVQQTEFTLCDWETANADLTMDYTLNVTDKLSQITIPINIIYGEFDFLSTVERQNELQQRVKNSKLHIIKGGMHQICIEKPKHVYTLLTKK